MNSEFKTPGKRLKYIRNFLGLTQKAFGEPLGLSESQIKDMEMDIVKKVFSSRSKIIYQVYKVSEIWLLTGQGEPFITGEVRQSAPEHGLTSDEEALLAKYRALDRVGQNDVQKYTEDAKLRKEEWELLKELRDELKRKKAGNH